MTRDLDLIRELLSAIEADDAFDGQRWITPDEKDNLGGLVGCDRYSDEQIAYHLNLLIEAGFVKGNAGSLDGRFPDLNRLTWNGHEFLASIKDKGIWDRTKERLKGLPDVTLAIVAAIAEAELKKLLGLH